VADLPEHTWVRDPATLLALAETLADAPWIALDSESNSMFVYRERVCLIQLNVGGRLWLLDPFALTEAAGGDGPAALAPIAGALSDPDVQVWVHGGGYDVGCLKRDFDIELRGLFDSQQAASFLGWQRTGYAAVVEALCEVKLAKEHTQYDWGQRPISDAALRYALDDVVYLPEVCAEMRSRIAAADLEDELAIANETVAASAAHDNRFDPERMWKLKGIRELPKERLPVLTAIYAWRNQAGRELDRPPGRLIANEPMLHLARRAPQDLAALRRTRLRRTFVDSHGESLLETIKGALAEPPDVPPRPRKQRLPPAAAARNTRLRDWRREEAERRELPAHVVLPPRAMAWLATEGSGALAQCPELGAKRIERYAEILARLCTP